MVELTFPQSTYSICSSSKEGKQLFLVAIFLPFECDMHHKPEGWRGLNAVNFRISIGKTY